MLRSGFVNGILLGTLAGALIGAYYLPKMHPGTRRMIMQKTRRMGRNAGRMVSDMAEDVQGYMGR